VTGRTGLALILTATVAACTHRVPPIPHTVRAERMALLEKIAADCRLPATTLKLVGAEDLRLQPPPDAGYEHVDCVLKALKKTDFPQKMGFVGNETYEPGKEK
jgi:hypothetical protein